MAGNRLVAEPNDSLVRVARQLPGCSQDPYDGLQALLHQR